MINHLKISISVKKIKVQIKKYLFGLTDKKISDNIVCEIKKYLKGGENMKANKEKLFLAMARACMGVSDIHEKLGMPIPTINNVIAGRVVRPATIGKIAKALGVDVTEIIEN